MTVPPRESVKFEISGPSDQLGDETSMSSSASASGASCCTASILRWLAASQSYPGCAAAGAGSVATWPVN